MSRKLWTPKHKKKLTKAETLRPNVLPQYPIRPDEKLYFEIVLCIQYRQKLLEMVSMTMIDDRGEP